MQWDERFRLKVETRRRKEREMRERREWEEREARTMREIERAIQIELNRVELEKAFPTVSVSEISEGAKKEREGKMGKGKHAKINRNTRRLWNAFNAGSDEASKEYDEGSADFSETGCNGGGLGICFR